MGSIREKCDKIIEVAMPLLGCHYLWGAAGATPDGDEGINRRRGSVALAPARTMPANPCIFAAQCSVDGLHVCGGRWDASHGGIEGGRAASPSDTDLIDYLAGLAASSPDDWKPFFESFSPRMVEGRTVTRQLVWGEDCRGIQHFDCVGFINYCIEISLDRSREVQYSIEQWGSNISGTSAVALTDPPHPADILITAENKHIGFLVGDGTGPGDWGQIVNAEQTSTGVILRPFNPSGWTLRRRLTTAILGG